MSREALARAMRDRRGELGLSVVDAVEQSGPAGERIARSTWRELEDCHRQRLTASVGIRIDKVLGWLPGTASRTFSAPVELDLIVGRAETASDRDRQISVQLQELTERLTTLAGQPSWADELLTEWRRLKPEDQATFLRLIRLAAAS